MRTETEKANRLTMTIEMGGREFRVAPLPCRAAIEFVRKFNSRKPDMTLDEQMEWMLDLFFDYMRPTDDDRVWIENNVEFQEIVNALESIMEMANPTMAGPQNETVRPDGSEARQSASGAAMNPIRDGQISG